MNTTLSFPDWMTERFGRWVLARRSPRLVADGYKTFLGHHRYTEARDAWARSFDWRLASDRELEHEAFSLPEGEGRGRCRRELVRRWLGLAREANLDEPKTYPVFREDGRLVHVIVPERG